MADGSIRIETKLDASELKKQIKELEKELKNIQKEQAKTEAQADQVRAKYKEEKDFDAQFPEEFSHRKEIDERTSKDLEPIIAKQEELNQQKQNYLQKLDAVKSKLEEQTAVTDVSQAKTKELGEEAEIAGEKAKVAVREAKKETNGFGVAVTKGIKKLGKMALAIFGIRGAYRAVRMALTEYLSTNKELEGQINTMKSLFAQVLGPAIEWVVNLLIKAVSAVNAFVYSLTGINIVAKANAAALKKQASAAGGNKNSSASFDEQTKLTDTGGAGGAGVATLPDGTQIDMSFLDPLKEALKRFASDIAPFIDTIKTFGKWLFDNFLVPLADWALNGVIPGFLNILGAAFLVLNDALWKIQPIALWIWDNFLEPIASWTGGVIVDVLNAIGDWIRDHQDTLSSLVAIIGGLYAAFVLIPQAISLVSAAFGILVSAITSPITWLTALIVLFVTLYDECEGFRKGMDEAWKAIVEIFESSVAFVKALFEGDWAGMEAAWKSIEEAGANLFAGLWEGLQAGWEWIKNKLGELWERISKAFCDFFGIHSPSTVFRDFGTFMMEGLVNGIRGAINKVTSACQAIWSAIKGVFSSVSSWFKNTFTSAWTAVKNVFSTGGKIFDGIKEGISSTFKTIVNGLIGGINKIIATPFNAINKMLNTIRSTSVLGVQPFKSLWSYNPLSVPQIPKLAKGGIVNRPGRGVPAIIGEAGPEAVLPLSGPQADAWMDVLADKISGGNVTIPIYLDGKKMYTYMVDIGKRRAFAANGG